MKKNGGLDMIKISPSILSGDFAKLGEEVKTLQDNGADMIHMDVMDGVFVPQITFGAKMVAALRKHTDLPLDVHLMIEKPENHIDDFIKAGADIITFHVEATEKSIELAKKIKDNGKKVGISIKPNTLLFDIKDLIPLCDMILIMTVEPGYGGQKLIPKTLDKVKNLRMISPDIDIEVDGGVCDDTIGDLLNAGANIIVAGSYVFKAEDKRAQMDKLRG
jgi:ribulose-phosphate 3-epimerase